ncbi:hypothetical protein B0178_11185 [Streptococcus pseudopneumoniae]|nr:hypothetical protein B0178_11185 [Streptococcus pseudopneumoniae]
MSYLLAWGWIQKTSFSHAPNIQQVQLLPVDDKQTTYHNAHIQNNLLGILVLLNHFDADHGGTA